MELSEMQFRMDHNSAGRNKIEFISFYDSVSSSHSLLQVAACKLKKQMNY